MATFPITHSGKQYNVTASTREIAIEALEKQKGPRQASDLIKDQLSGSSADQEYGFGDEATSGALYDFKDEIQGAVTALDKTAEDLVNLRGISFDKTKKRYGEARDIERERAKIYRRDNPEAALAANILGSAISFGGPIAKGLVKSGGLLKKTLRGAKTGAGLGTVQGLGMTEEDPMSLQGALETGVGTVLGAGVGALAPLAGGTIAGATRYVGSKIPGVKSKLSPLMTRTEEVAIDALDDMTPGQAKKVAQELGPEGLAMDVTQGLQSTAKALRRADKSAKTRPIQDAIESRKSNTEIRMKKNIEDNLSKNSNVYKQAEIIRKRQTKEAQEAFKKANDSYPNYTSPEILELLDAPLIQTFIKKIRNIPYLKDRPDTDSEIVDRVYKKFNEDFNELDNIGLKLRESLKEAITKENPLYEDALNQFATHELQLQLMKQGKNFLKPDVSADEIVDVIKNLKTGQEKSSYLTGALDSIVQKIDKGLTTENNVLSALGGKQKAKAFEALFETPADYKKFKTFLIREVKFKQTEKVVKPVVEEGKPQEIGRISSAFNRFFEQAGDVIYGSSAYALRNFIRGVQSEGLPEEVKRKLVKKLVQKGPEAEKFFDNLEKVAETQKLSESVRATLAGLLASYGQAKTKEMRRK